MSDAVIAWAWRTALGSDVDAVVARLLRGERAAAPMSRFDGVAYAVQTVAAVAQEPAPSRHARYLRRMGLLGVEVAREALVRSGRTPPRERLGLFAAVGGLRAHWDDVMPALADQRDDATELWSHGLRGIHPHWLLRHLSNNAHALAAADLHAGGEGATFAGAQAGYSALAAARRALAAGTLDVALVMAYDTWLEPETLVELGARGVATRARPDALAAPYGLAACGLVPGEAAAAVVLAADALPSAVLCRVQAADAAGSERGEATAETLAAALQRVDGGAGAVDGAARAWPLADAAERDAVCQVVAADTPLLATAAAFGHTGAASALVQTIALARMLQLGRLAPIPGLVVPTAGPLRPVVTTTSTGARVALGVATVAPGLAGVVRVEVSSR